MIAANPEAPYESTSRPSSVDAIAVVNALSERAVIGCSIRAFIPMQRLRAHMSELYAQHLPEGPCGPSAGGVAPRRQCEVHRERPADEARRWFMEIVRCV